MDSNRTDENKPFNPCALGKTRQADSEIDIHFI
jgi:hypothetical protein